LAPAMGRRHRVGFRLLTRERRLCRLSASLRIRARSASGAVRLTSVAYISPRYDDSETGKETKKATIEGYVRAIAGCFADVGSWDVAKDAITTNPLILTVVTITLSDPRPLHGSAIETRNLSDGRSRRSLPPPEHGGARCCRSAGPDRETLPCRMA
jgi:hypothetical protein